MTTKQQRKILEFAAKACGVELEPFIAGKKPCRLIEGESGEGYISVLWNPLTSPADCAEMCAELEIDTVWAEEHVVCHVGSEMLYEAIELYEDHDNSRLKAWMYAATMVAAKIGGYEDGTL